MKIQIFKRMFDCKSRLVDEHSFVHGVCFGFWAYFLVAFLIKYLDLYNHEDYSNDFAKSLLFFVLSKIERSYLPLGK